LEIGREFAGYLIEGKLGHGGMGVVYRARDRRLPRSVALKIMVPKMRDDEASRARFIRESRAAATVAHPHIVPLYAADECDGCPYIVTQLVDATEPDLAARLKSGGPLEPRRAVEIVEQVGAALHAAHEAGIVHRDVKPSNVLVVPGAAPGSVHAYLTDFGLARQQSVESGLTPTGQFVGTCAYVPPEQIEERAVDRRADVYALGCVLYECVTGSVPFPRATELGMIVDHLNTPPPLASARRTEVPTELDDVIVKAMAKEPGDRYPTCLELCAAARAALPDRDIGPALLVQLVHDGAVRCVAFSPDGGSLASASDDRSARVFFLGDRRELMHVTHPGRVRGARLHAAAFDPRGELLATAGRDRTAHVWRLSDGERLQSVSHDGWVRALAFSPDGRLLATASEDRTIGIWSPDGRRVNTFTEHSVLTSVAFSPDGRKLALAGVDGAARLRDLDSGLELQYNKHDDTVWAIAFSPDGRWLATASADRSAVIWDVASGHAVRRISHDTAVWAVAFSPDGRRLATAGDARVARVWDLADGRQLVDVPHDGVVWSVAFSPDGRQLATASADHTVRVWALT